MEKYVPLEKRSKKEQRAWHARQRGNWNGVKPVTRIVPSKKVYSRKKKRQEFPPDVFLCASPVVGTNKSEILCTPKAAEETKCLVSVRMGNRGEKCRTTHVRERFAPYLSPSQVNILS
jgi:hypothetical protein